MRRSRRLPETLEPNAWSRRLAERRAAEAPLLDLTETNPTRVGLGGEDAWLQALADPRAARYDPNPRGLSSARAAVAAYYAARGAEVGVGPEDIVLTSGTSESYAHLFRLLADPGDAVLVPAPSYPLFEPIAALEGVRVATYRLAYDGAWHLDLASAEAAFERAGTIRAAVVVQPNHPTGSCLGAEEVAALEGLCERHGAALISDQVFSDFPRPPRGAPLPTLLGARRVPTFVLGGLSKCCGLPQLKLGWIAAAGPEPARRELLSGLEWIADLFLSVGTPVQVALPRLLEVRHEFQARVRERIASNLAALAELALARPEVGVLPADGGWAAILRLPARRTGEEWALALLDRDVVAHPGHFYDLEGEAHLVLSLMPEPGVLRRGLERLADLLTIP